MPSPAYEIDGRELIAESNELRVQVLTVGAGQEIPWHRHSIISDTFFCLQGPMQVAMREPETVQRLECGDRLTVPPGQPHRVSGVLGGPCRFVIVQGPGSYDYIPEP